MNNPINPLRKRGDWPRIGGTMECRATALNFEDGSWQAVVVRWDEFLKDPCKIGQPIDQAAALRLFPVYAALNKPYREIYQEVET